MDNGQRDRDRSRRGDRPSRFSDAGRERSPDGKSECTRLFISNIPYDCRWSDLKDLFKEKVGDVAYVELFNDEQGKPRGCGIVEFTKPEATQKALEVMHRQEINGRKIILKEETGIERNRNFKAQANRPREDKDKIFDNWGRSEVPDSERFNTYGLSAQFLDSINVQPPLVKKVFVANLDYKVDQPKIKEIFKLAGKVRNIDLSIDKDGKSRGFAVVEYDHPVEAVQSISMFDRQMLFDRRMTVRMDRAHMDKPLESRLPEGLRTIGLGLGPNGEPLRDVARNLPSNQTQSNVTLPTNNASIGSGILGAVPAAGVSLNGLGAGMGSAGLGAGNALNSTALGLQVSQALGLTGLGALQSQLLQQGLSGELAGNIASALSAQQLGLGQAALGGLGGGGDIGAGARGSLAAGMGGGAFGGQLAGNLMNNSSAPSGAGYGRSPAQNSGNSFSARDMGMGNARNMGGGGGMQGGGGGGGGGMQGIGAGYGRGGAGDTQQGGGDRNKSASDMVVVSNLPPTVTWQILREKFSECGDVKFAEITSKDTAIVRFHKDWDAEMAIKMFDRTRIDGRTIEVRYF